MATFAARSLARRLARPVVAAGVAAGMACYTAAQPAAHADTSGKWAWSVGASAPPTLSVTLKHVPECGACCKLGFARRSARPCSASVVAACHAHGLDLAAALPADPEFLPAVMWNRAYRKLAAETPGSAPLAIGLSRPGAYAANAPPPAHTPRCALSLTRLICAPRRPPPAPLTHAPAQMAPPRSSGRSACPRPLRSPPSTTSTSSV